MDNKDARISELHNKWLDERRQRITAENKAEAFRKEEERQATDRDAKAAAFDELLKRTWCEEWQGIPAPDQHEMALEMEVLLKRHRQRLNVNPDLVSIDREEYEQLKSAFVVQEARAGRFISVDETDK